MKKNRTLFLTWLLSYLSILLIPVVASMVVYIVASGAIRGELDRTGRLLLDRIRDGLEYRLAGIEDIAKQISRSERLQALLETQPPQDPSGLMSQVVRELDAVSLSRSPVLSFFVYLPSLGGGISPDGFHPEESLSSLFTVRPSVSRTPWRSADARPGSAFVVAPEESASRSAETRTIAFLFPISSASASQAKGTIVLLLDLRRLVEEIDSVELPEGRSVLVLDDATVLLSFPGTAATLPAGFSVPGTGSQRLSIAGEDYAAESARSERSGWTYAVLTPLRVYEEHEAPLRLLMVASAASCILIGGLAALVMTRRHASPLRDLTENIMGRLGLSAQRRVMNEYSFVREEIDTSRGRHREAVSRLEEQELQLRSVILLRMLKGKLQNMEVITAELARLGLPSGDASCGVVLFSLENADELFPTDDETHPEDKVRIAGFIALKVVRETASRFFPSVAVESDAGIALIAFSFPEPLSQKSLRNAAEKIRDDLEIGFHIRSTAAVSSVHESVTGISEAYAEAVYALEYRTIWGEGTVVLFEGFGARSDTRYSYPIETELQLIGRIKAGDLARSKEILEDLFRRNIDRGRLSAKMARSLFFDIASTFIKTLNDFTGAEESAFLDELDPVERLSRCGSTEEMQTVILELLSSTTAWIDDRRTDHGKLLTERVKAFVKEHYTEVGLNVGSIAESFHIGPDYLAEFFREQTGEHLRDYIDRLRVEKVKELLPGGNRKIRDIAHSVGFGSTHSLIRTFKKHAGVTPGQYRETALPS